MSLRFRLADGFADVGGHRYAGNVIIYLPNGVSIWYGRVTPHDVGAIVRCSSLPFVAGFLTLSQSGRDHSYSRKGHSGATARRTGACAEESAGGSAELVTSTEQ